MLFFTSEVWKALRYSIMVWCCEALPSPAADTKRVASLLECMKSKLSHVVPALGEEKRSLEIFLFLHAPCTMNSRDSVPVLQEVLV